MTCTKRFACDLCRDTVTDDAIGIRFGSGGSISAVYMHDSEHHICNRCCAGLRGMFADLDRMEAIRTDLALAEERERAG